MELRREPYLRKFKKDNEAAVAKKIKELQQAAEQQRNEVKSLLVEEPIHLPQQEPLPPPPTASARTVKIDTNETTQTARKKHKCEDYLCTEAQLDLAGHAGDGEGKPALPMLIIPGKEEDKELEYLKSDEYKKYLEKLTQAHSKEDKAKVIKQNRNNNIYLGKAGTDRKQYIQQIIRTKEVLPRVSFQFLRDEPQAQTNFRGQLVNSYMYNEREIQRQARSNRRTEVEPTRREIEQESPIKRVQQQFELKPSNNVTIVLSPVCQKFQKEQSQKQVRQFTLLYHNHQSKTPEIPKATNKLIYPKLAVPQVKTLKSQTYRHQFEYCEKISNPTARSGKQQQKYEQQSFKAKRNRQNKQNYTKRAPPSPSRSPSSNSSFSERNRGRQNIYEISFKIDKPAFPKRECFAEPKQEARQALKGYSPNYMPHQASERSAMVKHCQPAKHCQPGKQKAVPEMQRIFTEYSYHPCPPESSETNSAITQQQRYSQSRSPHKISLISRSKHRRLP